MNVPIIDWNLSINDWENDAMKQEEQGRSKPNGRPSLFRHAQLLQKRLSAAIVTNQGIYGRPDSSNTNANFVAAVFRL